MIHMKDYSLRLRNSSIYLNDIIRLSKRFLFSSSYEANLIIVYYDYLMDHLFGIPNIRVIVNSLSRLAISLTSLDSTYDSCESRDSFFC